MHGSRRPSLQKSVHPYWITIIIRNLQYMVKIRHLATQVLFSAICRWLWYLPNWGQQAGALFASLIVAHPHTCQYGSAPCISTVVSSFRSKMTTLPKSKVRENLNGLLLLLKLSFHEILNRHDSNDSTGFVQQGKMADVFHQHFCHAVGDSFIGGCGDQIGTFSRDFFHKGILRGLSEEGDFADVITFTNHSGDLSFRSDAIKRRWISQ